MMTNSLVNPELYTLSIQVSLDGFSFYINDATTKNNTYHHEYTFENAHTVEQTLIEIQKIFETTALLQNSFKNVIVVYVNELFTLVPKSHFTQKNITDYLKFNTKILKTDFIVYDELESLDLINVYVPYTNINNFFFDHFGTFTYYHSQSILIKNKLEQATNSIVPEVFVQVNKKSIDVLAYQNRKLLLSNHFQCETEEDFTYYILFCYEQLSFDPQEVTLKLCGTIDLNDSRYKMIYEYIRTVTIENNPEEEQLNNSFLQYNLSL